MSTPPLEQGVLAKLPMDLHYLIEPVLRYACRTEWDVFSQLESASKQQMEFLSSIAKRVLENDHYSIVTRFLGEYSMSTHDECAQLYFFFGLLDHGGLTFD
jgi:hypothetical protein